MYCSDQQIHLLRFSSLFNAKTGYGCLDTAKSLDNSLWSLSRSQSPKLKNVSEYIQPKQERSQSQKFQTLYTSATCYKMAPDKLENGAQHAMKWHPIS